MAPGGAARLSFGELDTAQGALHAAGEAGRLSYSGAGAFAATEGWDAVPGRIASRAQTSERDGSEAYQLSGRADYALTEALTVSATGLARVAEAEFDTFSGGPKSQARANDRDLRSETALAAGRLGVTYAPRTDLSVTANLGAVLADFEERDGAAVTGDVRGERLFGEVLGRYRRDAVTLSAGAMLEREEADIPISFSDPLLASETHAGAFAYVQTEATDALTLSGALRIDGYEGFGTPVTWNAGAAWTRGALRLRANAGTAFNAPSLAERFSRSAFNVGNPDLEEETALAAEAAAAYLLRLRPGTLTAEAVLFRTGTDDLIEYDFVASRNVNVGDARAQGAELSLAWEGGALSAYAAYTYTDAENLDTGAPLLRRPEHGVTARAAWRASERLVLSARWVRTGERPDVRYDDRGLFAGTGEVEAFGLVAATAAYEVRDGLSVFAAATNLLGEDYEQPQGFGGAPRRFRAGLRYGW